MERSVDAVMAAELSQQIMLKCVCQDADVDADVDADADACMLHICTSYIKVVRARGGGGGETCIEP